MDPSTGSPIAPHDPDDLRLAIDRLGIVTTMLRRYGLLVLCLTMTAIAALLLVPCLPGSSVYRMTVIVVTTNAFATLGALAFFETRRKEGNAIFEEISDELQWRVASSRADAFGFGKALDTVAAREKPGIEARLTLRSFTQASDLPLVPGAFGPVVYALFNLSLVILSYVLPRAIGL